MRVRPNGSNLTGEDPHAKQYSSRDRRGAGPRPAECEVGRRRTEQLDVRWVVDSAGRQRNDVIEVIELIEAGETRQVGLAEFRAVVIVKEHCVVSILGSMLDRGHREDVAMKNGDPGERTQRLQKLRIVTSSRNEL